MTKPTRRQKGIAVEVTVKQPKPAKRRTAPGNPEKLLRGNDGSKSKDKNGCTEREARFIEFYIIHWNGTKAIKQAGFECENAHAYATQLLNKPHIKKVIAEKRKEFREQTLEIRDRLTAALVKSAFYDYNDYVEMVEIVDPRTKKSKIVPQFKTTDALERGAGELINSMKIGKEMKIELTLDDKKHAREMLARHIGYYEMDNEQQKSSGVKIYMPDNSRGDVIDSSANPDENS